MKRARFAFGIGFVKKKIKFSGRGIGLHLPRPQIVMARADPGSQPREFRRREPLGSLLNFFDRAHGRKDSRFGKQIQARASSCHKNALMRWPFSKQSR